MEAERLSDRATVGRCSNNLGSIATLRGDYGKAVGCFTMALAAFQQAGNRTGVAETLHNMAIAYREQNDLVTARETAERAAHEARKAGDLALTATIEAGCAEIQLQDGDEDVALVSVRRALAMHREIGDVAGESEDLRTLAATLARSGDVTEARALLPKVITCATELNRPLLAAQAERDLAKLLHEQQRDDEAEELGRRARARFQHLGSEVEVRRLDQLLAEVSAA
jgi:tetratricopeptide (TPR) repeat protein